jgi:hypothetical protein
MNYEEQGIENQPPCPSDGEIVKNIVSRRSRRRDDEAMHPSPGRTPRRPDEGLLSS